jgi:hypothetical protein
MEGWDKVSVGHAVVDERCFVVAEEEVVGGPFEVSCGGRRVVLNHPLMEDEGERVEFKAGEEADSFGPVEIDCVQNSCISFVFAAACDPDYVY